MLLEKVVEFGSNSHMLIYKTTSLSKTELKLLRRLKPPELLYSLTVKEQKLSQNASVPLKEMCLMVIKPTVREELLCGLIVISQSLSLLDQTCLLIPTWLITEIRLVLFLHSWAFKTQVNWIHVKRINLTVLLKYTPKLSLIRCGKS